MEILSSKETGKLIRFYRKALGITQFQLAEQIEIDDKQLGKIERGIHYPSMPTFLKLIKILNINLEEFYCNNPQNPALTNSFVQAFDNATKSDIALLNRLYRAVKNI